MIQFLAQPWQNTANFQQRLAMTREDVPAQMRDPNKLSDLLPVVNKSIERLFIR